MEKQVHTLLNDYLNTFINVLGICEPTDSMFIGSSLVATWRSANITLNMTIFPSGNYEGFIRYLRAGTSLEVKGSVSKKDYQVELYRVISELCR